MSEWGRPTDEPLCERCRLPLYGETSPAEVDDEVAWCWTGVDQGDRRAAEEAEAACLRRGYERSQAMLELAIAEMNAWKGHAEKAQDALAKLSERREAVVADEEGGGEGGGR